MSAWQAMTADEKIAVVRAGHAAGRSRGEIAGRLGTTLAAVRAVGRRAGLVWAPPAPAPKAGWAGLDRAGRRAVVAAGIAAGQTTTEIARAQGVTRNVIIGVAHRAGMRFGGATPGLAERREGSCSPAAAPAAPGVTDPPEGSDAPAAAGRDGTRPAPSSPAAPRPRAAGGPEPGAPGETPPEGGADPAPEPLPPQTRQRIAPRLRRPEGGKSLTDLVSGDCRFPLWGSRCPPFGAERFCGAAVVPGKSWCAAHHAVCIAGRADVPKAVLAAADAGGRTE